MLFHFISYMPPTCLASPRLAYGMVSQSRRSEENQQSRMDGGNRCEYQINQANQPTNQLASPRNQSKLSRLDSKKRPARCFEKTMRATTYGRKTRGVILEWMTEDLDRIVNQTILFLSSLT